MNWNSVASSSKCFSSFEIFPMGDLIDDSETVKLKCIENKLNSLITKSNFGLGNHPIVSGDKVYYISLEKENNPISLAIADLSTKSFAKGGFGKVYNDIRNINNCEFIFKISRKKIKGNLEEWNMKTASQQDYLIESGSLKGIVAKNNLISEHYVMQFIKDHSLDQTGLNCLSSRLVEYKNQVGFFIKKFDCDGVEYIQKKPKLSSCINIVNQLFKGLKTLHNLNFVHRDIKLENTLIKGEEGVISDFGNACSFDSIFTKEKPYPNIAHIMGCPTRRWVSLSIMQKIDSKLSELRVFEFESLNYKEVSFKIFNLLKSNDLFALSLSSYVMITKEIPPFKSFNNGVFFQFDQHLSSSDKTNLINQLFITLNYYIREEGSSNKIMNYFVDGL